MDNIKAKIKLIFVPYLIISLATVIGWVFLHWLLFIKYNFQVSEGVSQLWIPLFLFLTSFFIWLYRKIKLLNTKGNLASYILVPWFTMFGLSYFAQQFFTLTIGGLTNLSSISQIEYKEPTKFYSLKNFYLDKKQFSLKKQFRGNARHGNSLEMYIYITVPILNSVKDTLGSNCAGWYGVQYSETARGFMNRHNVKQSLSPGNIDITKVGIDTIENSKEVKRFVKKSMTQFEHLNLNEFLYLDRISKSESGYDEYVTAIKNNTKYNTKSDVVLLPCNQPLADRAIYNLMLALLVFGGGSLLFLMMVINTNLKSEDEAGK